MTSHTDLDNARNETLRKVGRNVVNFQKIEGMLRHLLAHGNVKGCASELKRLKAQRVASLAKQSMGRLADAFTKSTYSRRADPDAGPEGLSEAWVFFSFEVESDEEYAKEKKRALKVVVEERNKLIHQMLAHFNPSSLESCKKLSAELDDQNAKIIPEYKFIQSMVGALNDDHKELLRYFDSEGWGKTAAGQDNGA